ncbi:MAG: glycoside hydrolase family 3 C-terminal domain-containing protein [Oscillospiraceae bacterium]
MDNNDRLIAKELVAKMTLEEKASLCSGLDFWHTKGVERVGVPSVMVTDGPHGLRKQAEASDHLGINQSVPATCFPTAVTTSCSFDRDLMHEMGEALGEECLQENVAVILGPGANIKRSPLCGRNFEYISEDPYLAGETAAALINGVQSKNVGTSLKHYLLNNQEKARLSGNSIVDERAMREIYMPAFETAVKKAQPWTVMCSYNKIGGTYASDNTRMMSDVLRGEWGFKGAVMTDWGAMNDRVQAVKAGLDLEMPASGGSTDAMIVSAVRNGNLSESLVDICAVNVATIAIANKHNKKTSYDAKAHHALAGRIARESAVLLKNENVLPCGKKEKIAVIGQFAKKPRYQGAGSSKIAPTMITTVCDAFTEKGIEYTYSDGYDITVNEPNQGMIASAVAAAKAADKVLCFVGLTDEYESEGYDRTHIDMPAAHNALVKALCGAVPNVAVILFAGSVVNMPWLKDVGALLNMSLAGQNNGTAAYDLLFGDYSPCGKLTETYPISLSDTPSYNHFGKAGNVEYRESIYVGYRYYDKAKMDVVFPFGYGLSYSKFEYSDLTLDKTVLSENDTLTVTLKVKNTGSVSAKEIVQLYVSAPETTLFKPLRELREYAKISLNPGEEKTVSFALSKRAFAYYNVNIADWAIEDGEYTIELAASSRDIRLSAKVQLDTINKVSVPDYRSSAPAYFTPNVKSFDKGQFEALLGYKVPEETPLRPFTENSTLGDIQSCFVGRMVLKKGKSMAKDAFGGDTSPDDITRMMEAMMYDMPLRALAMMSGGMVTPNLVSGLVDIMNGKYIKGFKTLTKKQ